MAGNPQVGVDFKVNGLEGVRQGIRLVKDEAEPVGREWANASKRISFGLEEAARSGELAGRSLREMIVSGTEIALQFSTSGPLVAAFAITGMAIYEHITKGMEEAEQQAKKTAQEIGNLANAGDLGKIRNKARDVLYGQPFDKDGNLVASSPRVPGAFKGSLADLEAEYQDLQKKLPKGVEYATGEIAKRWNEVVPALNKAREAFRQLQEAATNVASQPAGDAGMLAGITSKAKAPITDPVKAWAASMEELRKQQGYAGGQGSAQQREMELAAQKYAMMHPDFANAYAGGLPGLKPVKITEHTTDSVSKQLKESAKQIGEEFSSTLADSITAGIEKAFARGANIGTAFAALGDAALSGLGSIAIQIGKAALTQFAFIKTISAAIAGWAPWAGIPAAIGLIAFGSALHGAGSRMSANAGGGGYGGGSAYSASSGYGSSIIDRGMIDPTRGAGVPARNFTVNNVTIIGPNDPVAQRQFQELLRNGSGRGGIG